MLDERTKRRIMRSVNKACESEQTAHSALFLAVKKEVTDAEEAIYEIEQLLQRYRVLRLAKDEFGDATLLHYAVSRGNQPLTEWIMTNIPELLDTNRNRHDQNDDPYLDDQEYHADGTPLFYAATYLEPEETGLEFVQLLHAAGANINGYAPNVPRQRSNVISLAIEFRRNSIAKYLIDNDVDIILPNDVASISGTILQNCSERGNVELLSYLREQHPIKFNQLYRNIGGDKHPLLVAISGKSEDAVDFWLKCNSLSLLPTNGSSAQPSASSGAASESTTTAPRFPSFQSMLDQLGRTAKNSRIDEEFKFAQVARLILSYHNYRDHQQQIETSARNLYAALTDVQQPASSCQFLLATILSQHGARFLRQNLWRYEPRTSENQEWRRINDTWHVPTIPQAGAKQTTPLHLAAAFGRYDVFRAYLQTSNLFHIPNGEGYYPLHYAVATSQYAMLKVCFSKIATPEAMNAKTINGETVFTLAPTPFMRAILREMDATTSQVSATTQSYIPSLRGIANAKLSEPLKYVEEGRRDELRERAMQKLPVHLQQEIGMLEEITEPPAKRQKLNP